MNAPTQNYWTILKQEATPPAKPGDVLSFHITLQAEDGNVYFATVSGAPESQATNFVQALQGAAHAIARSVGGSVPGAVDVRTN